MRLLHYSARLAATALFASLLSGCEDPRVDASSEQALAQSFSKMKAALPEEKREAFELALSKAATVSLAEGGNTATEGLTQGQRRRFVELVEGKSAVELMTRWEGVEVADLISATVAPTNPLERQAWARASLFTPDAIKRSVERLEGTRPELLDKFIVLSSRLTNANSI